MIDSAAFAPSATPIQLPRELEQVYEALGRHYITYYPSLARVTGGPKPALMLGHAIYLTRDLLSKEPERQGWFWKSRTDWLLATGLDRREQETARDTLKKLGLIREMLGGMPARRFYQLDLNRLGQLLCSEASKPFHGWQWEDAAMRVLLGRIMVFYAPLAWVAGSVAGGIYLSQLLSDRRNSTQASSLLSANGYLVSRSNRHWEDLAIGTKSIRNAREVLEQEKILDIGRESKARGMLLLRINLVRLTEKITEKRNEIHSLLESSNLQLPFSPNWRKPPDLFDDFNVAQNAQQTVAQNAQQTVALFAHQVGRKGQVSIKAFNKHTYNHLQTDVITQPEADETKNAGGGGSFSAFDKQKTTNELIYPAFMTAQEKTSAWQIICACDNPQLLLDEIEGQRHIKILTSPLGYLARIAEKARQGQFAATAGLTIQRKRENQTIELMKLNQVIEKQAQRTPEEINTAAEAKREAIEVLRKMFGRK
ncbi:MAG: hypothetical protein RL020_216 [Pseudomonadota bacterium]